MTIDEPATDGPSVTDKRNRPRKATLDMRRRAKLGFLSVFVLSAAFTAHVPEADQDFKTGTDAGDGAGFPSRAHGLKIKTM